MTDEERHELHLKDHESVWLGIVFGIINRKIFREENLYFDEDIFMYSDEVEWCYRLMKKGYKHYFTAKTTILHWNGGSSTSFSEWRHGQIIISSWLNLIKTKGKFYFLACMIIFLLNMLLDRLFFFKNKIFGRIKDEELEQRKIRKLEWQIFKKYIKKLIFNYHSRTSSNGNFLKFELN
jgi:GT2 family glycosyltransferase